MSFGWFQIVSVLSVIKLETGNKIYGIGWYNLSCIIMSYIYLSNALNSPKCSNVLKIWLQLSFFVKFSGIRTSYTYKIIIIVPQTSLNKTEIYDSNSKSCKRKKNYT